MGFMIILLGFTNDDYSRSDISCLAPVGLFSFTNFPTRMNFQLGLFLFNDPILSHANPHSLRKFQAMKSSQIPYRLQRN